MRNSQVDTEISENERSQSFSPASKQDSQPDDGQKAKSMNTGPEQHPLSHLFTLRVWEEDLGGGRAEWRGRVQEVTSGETLFFRDWPGLIATLRRLIAKTGFTVEGSIHSPLHIHENDE